MANNDGPRTELQVVRAELMRMEPQFKMALPQTVPSDRFVRVLMTSVSQNPDLLQCDRTSLLSSAMAAAQLGLYTDGLLGEAYLMPFKGKVQLVPGYRGLIKLMWQSGFIASMATHVVYQEDEFIVQFGDEEKIHHVPNLDGDENPEHITHAYAVARFKDGGITRVILTRKRIEKIRMGSPGANGPSWRNHYAAMCEKTALRRLADRVPKSTEASMAMALSDAADRGAYAQLDGQAVVVHEEDESAAGGGTRQQQTATGRRNAGTRRLEQAAGGSSGPAPAVDTRQQAGRSANEDESI